MKVKIAYTVDLEQIPAETAKMLENFSPKIEKISTNLKQCEKQIASEDITNAIKSLEEINSAIYECSLIVGDCYSVLTDYIKTKFQNQEAPQDAAEEG
tara:strand:- start:250 stop:543 length:294 start_codon:yes stop_codon:yes gene_type:complete